MLEDLKTLQILVDLGLADANEYELVRLRLEDWLTMLRAKRISENQTQTNKKEN